MRYYRRMLSAEQFAGEVFRSGTRRTRIHFLILQMTHRLLLLLMLNLAVNGTVIPLLVQSAWVRTRMADVLKKKKKRDWKKEDEGNKQIKQIILRVHRIKHLQSEDFVFRSFFASELVTSFIHSFFCQVSWINRGVRPPRYPLYFADWLQVSRCSLSSSYPLCFLAAFPSHCDTTRLPR